MMRSQNKILGSGGTSYPTYLDPFVFFRYEPLSANNIIKASLCIKCPRLKESSGES
jgi:hypothetical protein